MSRTVSKPTAPRFGGLARCDGQPAQLVMPVEPGSVYVTDGHWLHGHGKPESPVGTCGSLWKHRPHLVGPAPDRPKPKPLKFVDPAWVDTYGTKPSAGLPKRRHHSSRYGGRHERRQHRHRQQQAARSQSLDDLLASRVRELVEQRPELAQRTWARGA